MLNDALSSTCYLLPGAVGRLIVLQNNKVTVGTCVCSNGNLSVYGSVLTPKHVAQVAKALLSPLSVSIDPRPEVQRVSDLWKKKGGIAGFCPLVQKLTSS